MGKSMELIEIFANNWRCRNHDAIEIELREIQHVSSEAEAKQEDNGKSGGNGPS